MAQSKYFLPEGKNAGVGKGDQSRARLKTSKTSNPWLDAQDLGCVLLSIRRFAAASINPAMYRTDAVEASLRAALIASSFLDRCPHPQRLHHSLRRNLDITLTSTPELQAVLSARYPLSSSVVSRVWPASVDLNPCIHYACKPSTVWTALHSATRLRSNRAPFAKAAMASEYLYRWLALGKPFPWEPLSSPASQNFLLK